MADRNASTNPAELRSEIGGAISSLRLMLFASVIVPAVVFGIAAYYDWRELNNQAVEQAARTTQILREHALKVFETHEFAIDEIDERIHGMDWQSIRGSEDIHRFLQQIVKRHQQVNSAYIVSPDGKLANSASAFPVPDISVADRGYFIGVRDSADETHIGAPVVGRVTSQPVINVSRRRTSPDGKFDGALVIAISLERFTSFYRGLTAVDGTSVTLARSDGRILTREPLLPEGNDRLGPDSLFIQAVRSGGKTYRTVGLLDSIPRIHGVERVGSYPIYVSYGLSVATVVRGWLLDLLVFGLFAIGAAVGLFMVSLLALQRVRSEQQVVARWQDEVQRRESAEHALRQTQKMEALGQLTGGVAHDFNNLLMVISGNLELLKKKVAGAGADRQITAIEHAARNGETLTRKLLAFSRRRLVKAKSIELGPFLPKVIDLIKPSMPSEIEIATDVPADIWPIQADADDLELACVNIVLNSRDAMQDGGTVSFSAQNRTLGAGEAATMELRPGDYVALAIRDTGAGIPADHMSRVFEPFFTTKEVGRGTGLGLSQVYGFAKQSGGTVLIDSAPGRGTTVTLVLPRSEAPAVEASPQGVAAPRAAGRVLLVEDNPDVAEATVAMLESLGCTVKHASAAEPALALLASGEKVDLVLSDIVMPGGIDGVQLARTLRSRYPTLAVLLTTGYSTAAQKAAGDKFPILLKPYQIEALRHAIGEAVGPAPGQPA